MSNYTVSAAMDYERSVTVSSVDNGHILVRDDSNLVNVLQAGLVGQFLGIAPSGAVEYITPASTVFYDAYSTVTEPIPTGTTVTVDFDTVRAETAGLITSSAGVYTVNETRLYQIVFRVSTDNTASARSTVRSFLELDVGSGFAFVPGSNIYTYNRNATEGENTASGKLLMQLNSGDSIRVRSERNPGQGTPNLTLIANACSITFLSV